MYGPLAPFWKAYADSRAGLGTPPDQIHGVGADAWWCGVIAALDVISEGGEPAVRAELARWSSRCIQRDMDNRRLPDGGPYAS